MVVLAALLALTAAACNGVVEKAIVEEETIEAVQEEEEPVSSVMDVACGVQTRESPIDRVAHDLPGVEAVEACEDITYARPDELDLAFDIYLPPGLRRDETRPAVVFLHGEDLGRDRLEDPIHGNYKLHQQHVARLTAALGYVGLPFVRRGTGRGELEPAVEDARQFLAFVDEHAEELFVDRERVCIWAISGGTWLGAWLALTAERPAIRCAVIVDGPLALPTLAESRFGWPLPEEQERWDPTQHASADAPALFITRASGKGPAIHASTQAFLDAADDVGMAYQLHDYTGRRLLSGNSDETRAIIERMIAFLTEHLD